MHGVSPISLLQYWDVQYSSWDSLINQLQSSNKTISYQISQKADFIYIPNGEAIIELNDNNTILMVITDDQLHFVSKKQNIGEQIRMHINQTIYSIDSVTSTICALLDIPIPFENHGVMLPGLIYQNKDHKQNALMVQIDDYLINAIQLYGHYVALNKQNYFKSSFSQDLESMAERFSDLSNQDDDQLKFTLLLNLYQYSLKLSAVINSEISGNLAVIGLAFIFSVLSLYFYFNKYPEQLTSNLPYLSLMSIFPFIQPIVLIFYSYQTKHFSLNNLVKIILCTTVITFQYQSFVKCSLLIFMGIFLLYQSKLYLYGFADFVMNFPIQIALISSCICLSYFTNLFLAPLLVVCIFYLKKNYSLILLVISLSQLNEWIIVIIMLASIKTKDNLFQCMIYGYFLLLTQPSLPESPLIYEFTAYKRIFSIFLFSILQSMFQSLQEHMNLSLTSTIDQNAFKKLIKLEINYQNYVIANAVVCTSLIVPLILVETFSHNQELIANQYFIFQLFIINIAYSLGSLLLTQEQEQEQELQSVVYTEEIELQI